MRQLSEIHALLDELNHHPASSLEDQDIDFKEWSDDLQHSLSLMIEMAICMANGGGGTVIFGVNDKAVGRSKAIFGVPPEIDMKPYEREISSPKKGHIQEKNESGHGNPILCQNAFSPRFRERISPLGGTRE